MAQVLLPPDGGGSLDEQTSHACLSQSEYALVEHSIQMSTDSLRHAGVIPAFNTESTVSYDWPLKKAAGLNWNSYYRITNYIDQDASTNLLDYHCDQRTYDGHRGTDIALWPFSWYLVNNDLVEVVASADGTIVQRYDGEADDNCSWTSSTSWNAVFVRHNDGSTTWYGHMKKNSVTSKLIGQTVVKGEYLGIVASSGISTGPHLHFEVRDSSNNVVDPWGGSCNSFNSSSCWTNQKPNREPTVNALLTHDAVPTHGCPSVNEFPRMQDQFFPGDSVHCIIYYHDQLAGDTAFIRLRQPDNTIWDSWLNIGSTTYTSSWWRWRRFLPMTGPFGTWQLEADYGGQTIVHPFQYGYATGIENHLSSNAHLSVFPNPIVETSKLECQAPETGEIDIYLSDITGRTLKLLMHSKFNKGEKRILDFGRHSLSSGIYFVTLQQKGNRLAQQKIIVQ